MRTGLSGGQTVCANDVVAAMDRMGSFFGTWMPLLLPFYIPAGADWDKAWTGAEKLRMVAQLIAARSGLGHRRQIFFVAQGGYDFHDNLLDNQALRLGELASAMAAFHDATVELGVASNVTTFTASDFGRGLQSNGRGSDHGWGGHHFVMGGAVNGNRLYGQWPTVALGGPQDIGQGRLLPTTPVDRYAATLARWFGASASDLTTVLPNLSRFVTAANAPMGFLPVS